ncbi:MAG TPA: hypothetical protein VIJ66_11400 [Solirubrobacteraceae bacterium]
MNAVYDKTWDLFMAASLSDDDLGYPDEVEFVPGDQEWADDVLWRNLTEGRPIVLVSEDAELLLFPLRRSLVDRLRGHVAVNVAHRTHGHVAPYATASRLGRHPVRQMRELAHA